jgi:hypothetical protein
MTLELQQRSLQNSLKESIDSLQTHVIVPIRCDTGVKRLRQCQDFGGSHRALRAATNLGF